VSTYFQKEDVGMASRVYQRLDVYKAGPVMGASNDSSHTQLSQS